jgi:formate dehydrogenase major subunit
LGASYGRGGSTTAEWDLVNSDCIVIQGANFAETHPVAYRNVLEARERGAKIIHIDPRFTRTSATANIYAPLRSGTDVVFLGGLINYVLQNELYFKEYVQHYTNASFLVNAQYKGPDELSGLFSGYDEATHTYNRDTWKYETVTHNGSAQTDHPLQQEQGEAQSQQEQSGVRQGPPLTDQTLSDPYCVFQILKRHFSRYTPEMVERVCGTSQAIFLEVAQTITANSGRERTTSFCYAVGWTQHSTGPQMIRAAAILQLLLGNVGRPGGGVMAMRGHATIQGSSDIPTLYNLLPGYLQVPMENNQQHNLAKYLQDNYSATGWWHNMPKYMVSMLKAWYGPHATKENDFCFHYLPKIGGDYSYNQIFFNMLEGKIKGMFVMGQNLGVGGINARLEVQAMQKLEWCVVRDLYPVETGDFWKFEGSDPQTVPTEVFLMPAAVVAEKEGSFTNTQRLVQWHDKAVDPPGEARSETHFVYHLGCRLQALYQDSQLQRDKPIQALQWTLPIKDHHLQEPDLEPVVREINGYTVADSKPVVGFAALQDDGSTACGCWIYSGMVAPDGSNRATNRKADPTGIILTDPHYTNHSGWGYAWPANRRLLYNRASADPDGKPWSERKQLVWWQPAAEVSDTQSTPQAVSGEQHGDVSNQSQRSAKGKWVGHDVPDFPVDKAPWTAADPHGTGLAAHSGSSPFIMQADGVGQLFAPLGLADGPLPTHYEAIESPVPNPLYPQQSNPLEKVVERPENLINPSLDPLYPHVVTTYRLTEHHTSGAMSRWVPWLSELQPELFAEIDPDLAAQEGLLNGDWATVITARGELELRVLVTERMQALMINGKKLHQIGLPYHWGSKGVVTGDTVNNMVALTTEPNVRIHEAKTFTANLRKGRRVVPPPSEVIADDQMVVGRGGEAADLASLHVNNNDNK